MKKSLLSVLLFALVAFAATPTAPTLYNNCLVQGVVNSNVYKTGNNLNIAGSSSFSLGGRDSLKGADTIVLLNKFPLNRDLQYAAQVWDSGGVADTIKYEIQYYSMDGLYKGASTLIDSAAGSAPAAGIKRLKTIDLAVNQTFWPGYITLIAKKPVATLVSKIYNFSLVSREAKTSGGGILP